MVIGVDTASSRWHAIGRAPWLPNGYLPSKWESKKGNADQNRKPLCESFDRFIDAAVGLVGMMGEPGEPVHLFVEHPLALMNPKTNLALGMAAGALWGCHLRHDVYWWWVEISSWQKMIGAATGKSEERKAKARAFAIEALGLAEDLDEDHYDAACVGEWGAREIEKIPDAWRPS